MNSRHKQIVDYPSGGKGVVELRSPNEAWYPVSMGAIRIYIPK